MQASFGRVQVLAIAGSSRSVPARSAGCAYRADLVVEGKVLVEVKAVDQLPAIYSRQLQTYLRLRDYRVGLLLNFGAPVMKQGIKRVVNHFPEK